MANRIAAAVVYALTGSLILAGWIGAIAFTATVFYGGDRWTGILMLMVEVPLLTAFTAILSGLAHSFVCEVIYDPHST